MNKFRLIAVFQLGVIVAAFSASAYSGLPGWFPALIATTSVMCLVSPRFSAGRAWAFAVAALYVTYRIWTTASQIEPIQLAVEVSLLGAALATAVALARQIQSLESIRTTDSPRSPFDTPSNQALSHMYREVCHARQHNRPLTVFSLRPLETKIERSPRSARPLPAEVSQREFGCRLAELIGEGGIVTFEKRRFLVLLKETNSEAANKRIEEIRVATGDLEVGLRIGWASFPQEVTLQGLIEVADAQLDSLPKPVLDLATNVH
jgi:hypothetical protein